MSEARSGGLSVEDSAALTARITIMSVSMALVLTFAKLFGWWFGGSVALLASLADSALDVVAALGTFIAVRVAVSPPDAEHRFGHGKAEAFASLLQAGLVFAAAALVGQESIMHLIYARPVSAEGWSLTIMLLSLALTAALVWAQDRVLAKTPSVAVAGDRAHYAADFASNIAALIGIGLAIWTRDPRWDAAAGLFVMLWLVWGAIQVLRDATSHLMDHELAAEDRQAIVQAVLKDGRIRNVHELRTRASGPTVHIQMHIDLDPHQSLLQAHEIVEGAEERVLATFPAADVLIHPDPEGHAEPHGRFGEETR